MKSILESCEPRADLLTGTFNPEIFTASLDAVMKHYRNRARSVHQIYTDAGQFFREATYPSDGLRAVVTEVFARIAGDNTVPAIHRLETGFGGGKTHTLIACAHIGFMGKDISDAVSDIIAPDNLPSPGDVDVVGISGDKIPVHRSKGEHLLPYTLWGEIAYQVGGEELYSKVKEEAESFAAPGEHFLQTVFGGRKVLLMIDELAQYAARFWAAQSGARQQLESFFMTLHGYAREHSGISIVETLAGATDAFAKQTEMLADMLSQVTGRQMTTDDALGIGQDAVQGLASVVSRDATSVVPVMAAEISRIMAKRLFQRIDKQAAHETAAEYEVLYRKNSALLPDEATRADFKDRLIAHYPFHPTLIDFLNKKLASYDNFQSTRGVLRVLALAVRSLWAKKAAIPMIHTCHLDLRDARTVAEVVGRTGSNDLLTVLNADVGGADTSAITGGISNAELADRRNPHPQKLPMYEYTWKTVFLHSLVGRDQGLGSNIFGLTEPEALFEVAFPDLTPSQVREALKEISNSAYYLRFNQGKYYASLDPSVNIALARIRSTLTGDDIDSLLETVARKVVSHGGKTLKVVSDVSAPEHIPDQADSPVLAIVALNASELDIEAMVTTAGPNRPRVAQNNVLVLVPETVSVHRRGPAQLGIGGMASNAAEQARNSLEDIARTVLAMRRLRSDPQRYGLRASHLEKEEFRQRYGEREKALETTVTESYKYLWYPSARGQITYKEIRTAGGEGGAAVIEQIHRVLIEDGELIVAERINRETLASLRKLFFKQSDTLRLKDLRDNFARLRSWPMIESVQLIDQIVRKGVELGHWCLFRMGPQDADRPEELFCRESMAVPLHLELTEEHGILTPEGAAMRGWSKRAAPDPGRVQQLVQLVAFEMKACPLHRLAEEVAERFGDLDPGALEEPVRRLLQEEKLMVYRGDPGQRQKPELIDGSNAIYYRPEKDDVIITPAEAAVRGWVTAQKKGITLAGKQGAAVLMPLIRRLGSIYTRGGKSTIDSLQLLELPLSAGARMNVTIENASPDSLKKASELFEVIDALIKADDRTEAYIEISDPQDDCPFVSELKRAIAEREQQ